VSAATDQPPDPRRNLCSWLPGLVALTGIGGAAGVILSSGSPGQASAPAAPPAEFESVQTVGDTVTLASEGVSCG